MRNDMVVGDLKILVRESDAEDDENDMVVGDLKILVRESKDDDDERMSDWVLQSRMGPAEGHR
jgi:hypothetical protein